MAQHNQISATLSPQDVENIRNAIFTIQGYLPFLVNMTPDERRTYPKMGDKTLPFVGKSLDYSKNNYQLVPPFLNVMEFDKDMVLVNQLTSFVRPMRSIVEGIEDTILLAGSESYSAALVFYQAVKLAAQMNIPGVKSIYEDLRARFPGRGPLRPDALPDDNGNDSLNDDFGV